MQKCKKKHKKVCLNAKQTHKNLCIWNNCRIFASEKENKDVSLRSGGNSNSAFEICLLRDFIASFQSMRKSTQRALASGVIPILKDLY